MQVMLPIGVEGGGWGLGARLKITLRASLSAQHSSGAV